MNPTRKRIQLGEIDSCKAQVRLRCLNEVLDEEKEDRNDTKWTVHGLGSAETNAMAIGDAHGIHGSLDPWQKKGSKWVQASALSNSKGFSKRVTTGPITAMLSGNGICNN